MTLDMSITPLELLSKAWNMDKAKSRHTENVDTITHRLMLHVGKIREFMVWTRPKFTSDNHQFIEQRKVFLFRFSLSFQRSSDFCLLFLRLFYFIESLVTLITFQSFQECSQFHFNKLIIKGAKIIRVCGVASLSIPLLHNFATVNGKLIKHPFTFTEFACNEMGEGGEKSWRWLLFIHCLQKEISKRQKTLL